MSLRSLSGYMPIVTSYLLKTSSLNEHRSQGSFFFLAGGVLELFAPF